jgi:hypothetical protein
MKPIHLCVTALFCLSFDLFERRIIVEAKNNELLIQEIKKNNEEIFDIANNRISSRKTSSIIKIQEIIDKDTVDYHTRKSELAKTATLENNMHYTPNSKIQEKRLKRSLTAKEFDGKEGVSSALSRFQKTLNDHKVTKSHVQEIQAFSASSIPKAAIVAHVQTHFPEKSIAEANDIVIAANIATGTIQSQTHDSFGLKKYTVEKEAKDLLKFEKAKELFLQAKKSVTI